MGGALDHRADKWEPVFRANIVISARRGDSKTSRSATLAINLRCSSMASRTSSSESLNGRQALIDIPKRSDGVGNALRAAFRGRLNHMPLDIAELLEKLS
jgi:hypothetical protein